tara:strand:- start:5282 stop:6085 length:804 start_codon:yes stop_codon:yes gene_type:complete
MLDKPKALCKNLLLDSDLDYARIYKDSGGATATLSKSTNGHLTDYDEHGVDDKFYLSIAYHEDKTVDSVCIIADDIKSKLSHINIQYGPDYSTLTTAKTLTEFPADRVFMSLESPVTAKYFRINLEFDSDPQTQSLKLYQAVIGKSITFPHRPHRPYSRATLHSEYEEQVTHGGVRLRSVFHSGRAEISHKFVFANDAEASAYRSLYRDTSHFEQPFWWSEEPDTDPSSVRYVFAEPAFSTTYTGPTMQEAKLSMVEQGPRFLAHEV